MAEEKKEVEQTQADAQKEVEQPQAGAGEKKGKEGRKPFDRRKALRIAGWTAGGIVAVLILAFIFRDPLIELGVKHVGSFLTGTKVTIGSFKTTLKGSVEVRDFKVGNPEGYHKPHAIEVGSVSVKIDVGTLLKEEPIVEHVMVKGVRIDMEVKGTRSNLTEIQANLEKVVGQEEAAAKKKKKSGSGPQPLIRKIALEDMRLSMSSSTLKSSVPVPIAPIYLKNVGGKGSSLDETLLTLFKVLVKTADTAGGTIMGGVDAVGSAGKKVSDGIKKLFK